MPATLQARYNSATDELVFRVNRTDDIGNPIRDEYLGDPANVSDLVDSIDWYYFSLDNTPSSAVVTKYKTIWADNPAYFASVISIFFHTTKNNILALLPSS